MEGAAGDPYRRPARRTQWLLSALAHQYGLDRGVENEVVVLATGLDQYLQEVFHHLDLRGAGRLPRSDFRALCAVLGLRAGDGAPGDGGTPGDDADAAEEARLALRAEPPELTFRQFHARLCGYFGARAGPRLPRGALSELVEAQIRLRRPRRRRPPARPPGPDGAEDARAARLEEENGSLRELVEDLRAALQSSDARCLALQVGLWKSQAGAHEAGCSSPEAVARQLRQAQGALAAAEARAGRLRQGQAEVRRRAEEARQALLRSLRRVRELEALAQQVPGLQRWVQQLEAELQRYRSQGPQLSTSPQASPEETGTRDTAASPERGWQLDSSVGGRALDEVDEHLLRSVEGQAASDDEEGDEKWQNQRTPPAAQAKVLPWASGCQSSSRRDDRQPRAPLGLAGGVDDARALGELEAHVARLVEQLEAQGFGGRSLRTPVEEAESQQTVAENDQLRPKLQTAAERVRRSLLEEKLVHLLQLLQRPLDLNVSKRALGRTLLSTLDTQRDPAQDSTAPGSADVGQQPGHSSALS